MIQVLKGFVAFAAVASSASPPKPDAESGYKSGTRVSHRPDFQIGANNFLKFSPIPLERRRVLQQSTNTTTAPNASSTSTSTKSPNASSTTKPFYSTLPPNASSTTAPNITSTQSPETSTSESTALGLGLGLGLGIPLLAGAAYGIKKLREKDDDSNMRGIEKLLQKNLEKTQMALAKLRLDTSASPESVQQAHKNVLAANQALIEFRNPDALTALDFRGGDNKNTPALKPTSDPIAGVLKKPDSSQLDISVESVSSKHLILSDSHEDSVNLDPSDSINN
jgi:hypothetical protein